MKYYRLVAVLLVAGLTLTAASSHAESLRFLPGLESGYEFAPTLAVAAGVANVPDANHDADFVYGLDFNFNCLLVQTPENHVRTHLQLNRTGNSGWKSTSLELSPRYTLPVGDGFAVGVGPVLALVFADNGRADRRLFGVGVVGGVEFRHGRFYTGADLRYLETMKRRSVDYDNWALLAKIGVNF